MKSLLIAVVALVTASTVDAQSESSPAAYVPRYVRAQEVAAIQAAGHRNDRSRERELLAALKAGTYHTAALHSLAQMGSQEAITVLDKQTHETGRMSHYSKAVRARLVAQNKTDRIGDPAARARALLNDFLTEVGLSVEQLNTAGKKQIELNNRRESVHAIALEIHALRELADMIHHNRDAALAAAAKAAGIDFTQDAPAELKVRLALLAPKERVEELVEELSRVQVIGDKETYMIQLAVNEGLPASRAAGAKLKTMNADPAAYTDIGFAALFRLIGGVGDKEQAPVIAEFLKDSNVQIAYHAKTVYEDVVNGIPFQYVLGY